MNRRDLLKRLPVLGIAPFLKTESPVGEYPEQYRGFKLVWSGWIKQANQMIYIGSWAAINPNPERMGVASAYPGVTSKAWPGYFFDTGLRQYQNCPGPWSTEAELESYKADAYWRMIRFLDMVHEELTS